MGTCISNNNDSTRLTINKNLADKIQELSIENNNLKEENNNLKEENNNLKEENNIFKNKNTIENNINLIDENKIKELVKKMLTNKDINIGLLPDKIEGNYMRI